MKLQQGRGYRGGNYIADIFTDVLPQKLTDYARQFPTCLTQANALAKDCLAKTQSAIERSHNQDDSKLVLNRMFTCSGRLPALN